MKNIIFIVISMTLTSLTYSQTVNKGDQIVSLGFGFDPYYHYNSSPGSSSSAIGPIVGIYEYIVTDKLGIGRISAGGMVGETFYTHKYTSYNSINLNGNIQKYGYDYKYNIMRTAVVARAAYHFDLPVEKLDIYAGVGGGIYIYHEKQKIENHFNNTYSKKTRTFVGGGHYVFAGARYFFTNAFGVYLEFGHGYNAINGGLSFKF